MCEWKKHGDTRIDPCLRELIEWLNCEHKTIYSCCGHGKYKPSIVVKEFREINNKPEIVFYEIFSGKILRKKKNWFDTDKPRIYKKDKEGYYYIPEIEKR